MVVFSWGFFVLSDETGLLVPPSAGRVFPLEHYPLLEVVDVAPFALNHYGRQGCLTLVFDNPGLVSLFLCAKEHKHKRNYDNTILQQIYTSVITEAMIWHLYYLVVSIRSQLDPGACISCRFQSDVEQGHCFQFVHIFKVLKSIEFGEVLPLVIMKCATFFLSFFLLIQSI